MEEKEKRWYEFDYGVKFAFHNRCKGVYEDAERIFKDTIISEELKTARPPDVDAVIRKATLFRFQLCAYGHKSERSTQLKKHLKYLGA